MPHYERRGFEQKRTQEADPIIKKAHERARKILASVDIDPRKFENYDKTMIARDMELVRTREAQFNMQSTPESREAKEIATILEAILHEQIGKNGWIGPNVSTIRASRYDDYENGVDSIAQFRREGEGDSHLGIALDATFSSHITEKLDDVKEDVANGKLTQIKYFASPNPENPREYAYMGSLKVPRVVIGIEKKAVLDLIRTWMQDDTHALFEHPIQHVIAKEIIDQLSFFERYARSRNRLEVAGVYKQVRTVVERSLKEKEQNAGQKNQHQKAEAQTLGAL